MRTLKKALCLVLVLAMVLSLSVSAFALEGKDYKDYSKVENKEAVDVLTAIGVLNGNDDGTFGPEGAFTRAQAAKMICYLTLGKTIADALPVGATQFNDVPATHWASKYIQYCANAGIIVGNGDGTFGPDATLSASAWAKMLLCALGYNAETENMTGTGWEINVTRLAISAKIASAEELTVAFNRDMAAQLAFNALKADMVQYVGGSKVTVNGVEIVTGANLEKITNTKADDYRENANARDEVQQLAEKAFEKLTLADKGADDFYRPATEWKNGTTVIGTYSKAADLTYTTAVSGGKIYTDLGKPANATVSFHSNGNANGTGLTEGFAVASGNSKTIGGNGTVIEVYKTGENAYTIVEIETFVSTIATHTDAVKNADGEITAKEKVAIDTTGFSWLQSAEFETTAFDRADENAHTVVLFTAAGNKIQSVKAAESLTVTASTRTDTSFVADGTTYKYSDNNSGVIAASDVSGKVAKVIYFDDYGYVIKVANPAAAATNYAIVVDKRHTNEGWTNTNTYEAKLVYANGEQAVVTINAASFTAVAANDIVSYAPGTGADAGKVVLTKLAEKGTWAGTIVKGVPTVRAKDGTTTTTTTKYANDKTIFFAASVNATTGAVTYTTYTGISNVPSMTCAGIQFVDKNNDGFAEVVFAYDTTSTSTVVSSDVIYVTTVGATATTDAVKGTYTVYQAVVNGTPTTIESKYAFTTGLYVSVEKDDNGVVTSATGMNNTSSVTVVSGTGTGAAANGLVRLDNNYLTYTDATTVYTVNATTGVITASSVSSIKTDSNDSVVYYTTNGVLTMAVITPVANS